MNAPAGHLNGTRILVTRPSMQAEALAQIIREHGGEAMVFPAIEIRPVEISAQSLQALEGLAGCQAAIFISANAVRHGLAQVSGMGGWPAGLPALAVGETTAGALRDAGIRDVIAPADGADSEALLRLEALRAVDGKRIVIFRGVGGRELLAQTLRARGAQVEYVECYERVLPQVHSSVVLNALLKKSIDAVSVNSAQGVENLFTLLGEAGRRPLCDTPMFAPHARIAQRARDQGIHTVVLTPPGDPALITALCDYFAGPTKTH